MTLYPKGHPKHNPAHHYKPVAGKLTQKRERFCQNIILGMSNTDAYKDAYNRPDADIKVATASAHQILNAPVVQKRIKELQDEIARENKATIQDVIEELAKIAFAKIEDYLSYSTEVIKVLDENNQLTEEEKINLKLKDSDLVDTTPISEVQLDKFGNLKFKMYPKDKALEMLGKYLGMFNDKVELTGKDGGAIEINDARSALLERLKNE